MHWSRIISCQFPSIGEAPLPPDNKAIYHASLAQQPPVITKQEVPQHDSNLTAPCDCPKRQLLPPKPKSIPFPPTDENREKLQQWLLSYYQSSTFNMCQHQPLPMMDSPPMRLMVDPEATAVAQQKPLPVPLHWREEIKAGLDQDVHFAVIKPVPIGKPVTWCHWMVVCPKKNGKPRRTVDFQALNLHATRETHHTQSPSIRHGPSPMAPRRPYLMPGTDTTLSPFTPMTVILPPSSPPGVAIIIVLHLKVILHLAMATHVVTTRLLLIYRKKTKCVDDTLLWSNSIEESFWQAVNWLDVCGHNGIILHKDTFVFASHTVEYAGFQIGPDSVSPCPRYLKAILDFPTPKNITDAGSWFGLLNQVSYAFSMATHMQPFRHLLKPGTKFVWNDHLNNLFKESKRAIVKEIEEGVRIFDPAKPTCLATDWFKTGIGFWLFQKHCQCPGLKPFCCHDGWKITLVGSRFTHPAESKYASIEGEALAVTYGLYSACFFVLDCPTLVVGVDHKPPLRIFRDRALDDIDNTRLQNLKERTLCYRFQVTHIPGIKHKAADATSRHPVSEAIKLLLPDDVALLEDISDPSSRKEHRLAFLNAISIAETSPPYVDHESSLQQFTVAAINSLQSVTWTRVRLATASNDDMNQLLSIIESGMPDSRHQLPPNLQEYFQFRAHLSTIDGVITYKDRIVMPPCLRDTILSALHSAHSGVSSMLARAESCFLAWYHICHPRHPTKLQPL